MDVGRKRKKGASEGKISTAQRYRSLKAQRCLAPAVNVKQMTLDRFFQAE